MARQGDLFNDDAPVESMALERYRGPLCCGGMPTLSGWLGPDHCGGCMIRVAESVRQFWQDVQAGKYDADGYTPADRRAQQRKRKR